MSIQLTELSPGYQVAVIDHPAARARLALHGAHLMEWTPAGAAPVLYLSPNAIYREGKAIRGGVPLCWPWFGPHPSDASLPAHGFARNRFWKLISAEEDATGASLRLSLTESLDTMKLWPHAFQLEMGLHIGARLRLSLTMRNTGSQPFSITGALHTYLAVGGIAGVRIEGLDGVWYQDHAGPVTNRAQTGDVHFTEEVDRIYATPADVLIHDSVLQRRLSLCSSGSATTVIWNPGIKKARALTDLPDDGHLKFVCVETANAWENAITLAPGETHTLGVVMTAD